jgi:uncharacterized membrane protein YoaT (DUF817 family)
MKPYPAIAFFIAGTILMVTLWQHELLLLALMAAASALLLWMDDWKRAKHFIIATLIGGACENLAVAMGAWHYVNAGYLFAPLWLPVGWGMAVVLLDEAFGRRAPVKPSKTSAALAFIGTIGAGITFQSEFGLLAAFAVATAGLFLLGYHRKQDIVPGVMAAVFGTAMETACIFAGNWHYSMAMLGTPLWLPLCWFNAFLIMRRAMRIAD